MTGVRRAIVLSISISSAVSSSPSGAAEGLVGPYLQALSADGVVVVWDSTPAASADLEIDLPDGMRTLHAPTDLHHELAVASLPPGHFAYRLKLPDGTTAAGHLHAAPRGDAFTFLVYGDNRDRDADHRAVITAMNEAPAELALQTGDMVGNAGQDALWRRFFAIEQPLLASMPMYPAIGNHELLDDPQLNHYRHYFVLPSVAGQDAQTTGHERYYTFTIANSLFIALDGNQSASHVQAAWLHKTLDAAAKSGVRHTFIYFHQPSFSVGQFCGSAAEQGLWVPEFEHHPVTAVFTGHEHAYQHLERNGVRYFVVGGGGAPLIRESGTCPAYDRAARRLFRSTHQFVRIDVRGEAVALTSIDTAGQVIEKVDLSQRSVEAAPPPTVPFREQSTDHPEGSQAVGAPTGLAAWTAARVLEVLGGALLIAVIGYFVQRRRRQSVG